MPDGGGSSDNNMAFSSSNTNSKNTSGPNPTIAPMLGNIADSFWGHYANNANAPAYYPGSTVAGQGPRTASALTGTWQRGAATPYITAPGYSFANDTLSGKYLDPKENPAFQDFLAASFRPQAEQFRDIIAPSIDSKFAGAGRTAGGAHYDTTMRGASDLTRNQSDAAAKVGLGLYQGERDKQIQAANLLPVLQGMDFQGIAALQQAGAADDAFSQRNIDADIARYNYDKTAQPDWYARMAQLIQGIYPGGQTVGNTSSSGTSYAPGGGGGGGGFGSFLGPMMSLGGGAMSMFGGGGGGMGGMFSDERDKTDIEELGTDPLTGLPMFAYRYKSDPKTYPKVVGPMAQDIEARGGPVREIGGHKVVGGLF